MKFDYISDIHVDFWLSKINNVVKCEAYLKSFVSSILPDAEIKSDILIIAGDISNSNNISKMFLTEISRYYELILLVWGNHDFYLDSKNMKRKFKSNSFNKIKELEEFISSNLLNVKVLNGDTISYKGITYGGTGLWYNLKYSVSKGLKSYDEVFDYYTNRSNDYSCVFGKLIEDFYNEECDKMHDVLKSDVDVIISHIVPSESLILNEVNNKSYNTIDDLNMYLLNNEYLLELSKGKIWIYGHFHGVSEDILNNTVFLRNCVGYPEKKNGKVLSIPNKIKTYNFN